MTCSKHPQRKRADCPDCFPPKITEVIKESSGRVVKDPAKKSKIPKAVVQQAVAKVTAEREEATKKRLEERYENKVSKTVYKPNVPISPIEEQDREIRIDIARIREYVDTVFAQALEKVKIEINAVKNIRWEHMNIPLTLFNIDLLMAIGTDGWKLVDLMRNPKQYGYPDVPDYAIIQRVVKPDNSPLPDFSTAGNVRKYLEKKKNAK